MNRKTKLCFLSAATILVAVPVLVKGYASGPDPRNTGAPGDEICARSGCHAGTAISGRGVTINFGPQGMTYSPGVTQRWTITVDGLTTAGYGFQVTARLASNERTAQAGGFRPIDRNVQVLCDDGRVKGTGNCRADATVEFAEHTQPSRTNSFQLDWTPPATNAGNVRVYAAGNAANLNGSETGDQIFLNNFTLTFQAAPPPPPQPAGPQIRSENPVLQAYSGQPKLSSGTWLQIFGSNFASTEKEWALSDFNGEIAPTSLGGVRVNINNQPAFVRYVSPAQVNVQVPDDPALGPVEIEVVNDVGASNKVRLEKTSVSPAMLTTPQFNVGGKQYLAAFNPDLTLVGRTGLIAGVAFRPAKPGGTIFILAVGCGATNPPTPAGQYAPDYRPLAAPLQVTFGQTVATASGFLAANAVGLCQFNVIVPDVPDGDIAIEATVDNVPTGQNLFTTIQK